MKQYLDNLRFFVFDFLAVAYAILGTWYFVVYNPDYEMFENFNTAIVLLAFLGAAVYAIFAHFRKEYSLAYRAVGTQGVNRPIVIRYLFVYLIMLSVGVGWHIAQVSLHDFFDAEGIRAAGRIFGALLTPEFKIFPKVVAAAIETVFMAFMATVFSLPIAFVLSFFASSNIVKGLRAGAAVYHVLRALLNISRSVEPLVWAIIFSVWVGIGPFAGMLALMVHSVASLAKLYSESIESVDHGLVEAITSTGAHPVLVVWYGVVPQVILPFISFTVYRWDINVRMATVIGLVGGGGLGSLLMQYQGLAKWHEVGMIILVITSIVWVMDIASAAIRKRVSQ